MNTLTPTSTAIRTDMNDRGGIPSAKFRYHVVLLITLLAFMIALLALAACQKKQGTGSVATAGPWRLELKTIPDRPSMTKTMTFTLHITDDHGQPVSDATVHGALTMKLMDMGATAVNFAAKGNGDYEAPVKGVDMSGPWNLAVDVAQGAEHAKKDFDVTVGD